MTFGEKVLEAFKAAVGGERKRSSVGGAAAKAHDEAEAERLVVAALAELGAPCDTVALTGRGRWKEEKEMVAARLGMGHEVSVTRAVRRYREDPKVARRLKALERKLGIR